MSEHVLIVERTERLLQLTLNRPDRANALSPDLVESLLRELEHPDPARVCVISGAGSRFCGGFDLDGLAEMSDGDLLWRFLRIERLLRTIHHTPFPVLVLAHAHAIGAGADLLCAASHRVGAPGTKIRMPGLNFGLALGTGRLSRLVGPDRARDILLDTRRVDTDEALAIGMLTDVRDQAEWPDVIEALCTRITSLSAEATAAMLAPMRVDTGDADVATIVATAGQPGLVSRVTAYRESAMRK